MVRMSENPSAERTRGPLLLTPSWPGGFPPPPLLPPPPQLCGGGFSPPHPRSCLSHQSPWMPGTSPGMTAEHVAPCRSSHHHSLRRPHLDRAGAGAAVARGVVHVLD